MTSQYSNTVKPPAEYLNLPLLFHIEIILHLTA